MVNKISTTSENIENENLNKLREIFPQFVKDGEIDFDSLQAFFRKEGVLAGDEKYGLSWSGKSKAFQAIRTPSTGTLIPEKDKSKNWDETENIFIEGDNLEVLKLLQKGYREKIKMIYIDPPYNTGKDFVYKDNFTQGVSDYYEQTGQTKGGIKMTTNTEKNGRYHSDWLTMMYPRLFLARNLLKEDGVIFVSIDDNEVANLRMMMDEIFGEENFVVQFIWEKHKAPKNDNKYVSENHEYCLMYAKYKDKFKINLLPRTEKNIDTFSNPDNDIRGKWVSGPLLAPTFNSKAVFPIIKPNGEESFPPKGKCWAFSESKIKELISDNRIWFGESGGNVPRIKRFLSELREGIVPTSMLLHDDLSGTQKASNRLIELFNDQKVFTYSKPLEIINRFLVLSTNKDENDLVFDFFAGSGTTAHAVMELNDQDGGNRKWICVQLPEIIDEDDEAYKAGYKTISEISRERIRRAGDKINKGDIGFKSYRLSSSNYRKWSEVNDEDELKKQSKLFVESLLVDNFNPEDVVYEIALKEGFGLNIKLKQDNGALKAYVLEDGNRRLFVTFSAEVIKEKVEQLKPLSDDLFVCFDNYMTDTDKVNIERVINLKTI